MLGAAKIFLNGFHRLPNQCTSFYFLKTGPIQIRFKPLSRPVGTFRLDAKLRSNGAGWQSGAKRADSAVYECDSPTATRCSAVGEPANEIYTPYCSQPDIIRS